MKKKEEIKCLSPDGDGTYVVFSGATTRQAEVLRAYNILRLLQDTEYQKYLTKIKKNGK